MLQMKIEILFGDVCSLYGDSQNITYLKQTLPEAEFFETKLTEDPYFLENDPDLILIGTMSERFSGVSLKNSVLIRPESWN